MYVVRVSFKPSNRVFTYKMCFFPLDKSLCRWKEPPSSSHTPAPCFSRRIWGGTCHFQAWSCKQRGRKSVQAWNILSLCFRRMKWSQFPRFSEWEKDIRLAQPRGWGRLVWEQPRVWAQCGSRLSLLCCVTLGTFSHCLGFFFHFPIDQNEPPYPQTLRIEWKLGSESPKHITGPKEMFVAYE